jgi:hypothetical protein
MGQNLTKITNRGGKIVVIYGGIQLCEFGWMRVSCELRELTE